MYVCFDYKRVTANLDGFFRFFLITDDLRIFLDDNSIIDFDVKAELDRIPCYKPLYEYALFKTVKFKNKRIYWSDQYDFNLDQILERGQPVASNSFNIGYF